MEAFFVVVTACALLAVAVWALVAMRHLLTFTHPDAKQPDSAQRRPGDD
ncbi:hypothetical protein ACVW00_003447 [Marmoricola sp. URHA0025 HA25]